MLAHRLHDSFRAWRRENSSRWPRSRNSIVLPTIKDTPIVLSVQDNVSTSSSDMVYEFTAAAATANEKGTVQLADASDNDSSLVESKDNDTDDLENDTLDISRLRRYGNDDADSIMPELPLNLGENFTDINDPTLTQSSSTRSGLRQKYYRFLLHVRLVREKLHEQHEIYRSHRHKSTSGRRNPSLSPVNSAKLSVSSDFTLPDELSRSPDVEAAGFVTSSLNTSEQHRYPRVPIGRRLQRTASHFINGVSSTSFLNMIEDDRLGNVPAYIRDLPFTPESLHVLLNTSTSDIPCREYLLLYMPLISVLVADAERIMQRMVQQPRFTYSTTAVTNLQRRDRPSMFRPPPARDQPQQRPALHTQLTRQITCIHGPAPAVNNGTCKYTSYIGFAVPAPLRFARGSRTFGEYVRRVMCRGAGDMPRGFDSYEVNVLLRKLCSPGLLISMSRTEGFRAQYMQGDSGHYSDSVVTRIRRNREYFVKSFYTEPVRRKRDPERLFVRDRSYIWRQRAIFALFPEIILRESPEEENEEGFRASRVPIKTIKTKTRVVVNEDELVPVEQTEEITRERAWAPDIEKINTVTCVNDDDSDGNSSSSSHMSSMTERGLELEQHFQLEFGGILTQYGALFDACQPLE
ncbi:uncharacterized protein V1518DRAFT_414226 [Limtongia smithiae]|uniref:uncharacterized protein n=1 Tax=Limtongia smithiae TaxID=1125753 RepID=UPI0034CD43F1